MRQLFLQVLDVSLSGSIVIAVILLLRLALKKAPKKYLCLLWLMVFLRLLIPFEIESSYSLQPRIEPVTESQWIELEDYGQILHPDDPMETGMEEAPLIPEEPVSIQDIGQDSEVEVTVEYVINWYVVLPYLWLAGIMAMALYTAVSCLRLHRRVADSVILSEGVWVSGKLDTAFVLGILRPRIYLNLGLTEAERELVLLHERCHIRRGDHLWKLLGFFSLAVHWFNPLVWAAYLLLCRDMEMACDEAVVRDMDISRRKAYSAALLSCATRSHAIAACPIAFGEVSVKHRIQKVLNYRKPGFWMILIALIAIAVVAVCFLTTPAEGNLLTMWDISGEDVSSVFIVNRRAWGTLRTPERIREILDGLSQVHCGSEPIAPEGHDQWSEEESWWMYLENGEEAIGIWCTVDGRKVWLEEREGEFSPVYPVENPEALLAVFESADAGAVAYRTVSGEPFATTEEPLAWVQRISLDAVEKATINNVKRKDSASTTQSGGIMMLPEFEKLLPLLNNLSEESLAAVESIQRQDPDSKFTSILGEIDGLCIRIVDGTNQLSAYLRLNKESIRPGSADRIELVLIPGTERIMGDYPEAQYWIIEDAALLQFLQEMRKSPSYILYWPPYREQLEQAAKVG